MTDLEFPLHLWQALSVLIEAYWLPAFCFGVLAMLADLKWSQRKIHKKINVHPIDRGRLIDELVNTFERELDKRTTTDTLAAIKTKVLAKKGRKK